MNVECRECGKHIRIIAKRYNERTYNDGVRCIDCWNKSKKSLSKKSSSVQSASSKSSGTSYSDSYDDDYDKYTYDPNRFFDGKYSVGDQVYLNTDKHGVILCVIIDTESWGQGVEYNFYTLDVKGVSVDYIDEQDIHETYEDAVSSNYTVKV